MDSFDLSEIPKLKEVVLGFDDKVENVSCVNATLNTINLSEHQDLQQVSIRLPLIFATEGTRPRDFKKVVGKDVYQQWMDLGRRLIQFKELHKINVKVVCNVSEMEIKVTHKRMRGLLFEKRMEAGFELDVIYLGRPEATYNFPDRGTCYDDLMCINVC